MPPIIAARNYPASNYSTCQPQSTFFGGWRALGGFTRAGFRILLAIDQDPESMKTYRLNHPQVPDDRMVVGDIRDIKAGSLRKLVGRKAHRCTRRRPSLPGLLVRWIPVEEDPHRLSTGRGRRNFLFEYMVKAAAELKPKLFLMENVPGMQSARKENLSFLESAAKELERLGKFKTAIWKLNASAFGVPQDRLRYFLVASSTGSLPARPFEEYQGRSRSDLDQVALPPVQFDEATFDLPALGAGKGLAIDARPHRPPNSG